MKMTVQDIPAIYIYFISDVIMMLSKLHAKKHAACVKMVSKDETSSNSIICRILKCILASNLLEILKYISLYSSILCDWSKSSLC